MWDHTLRQESTTGYQTFFVMPSRFDSRPEHGGVADGQSDRRVSKKWVPDWLRDRLSESFRPADQLTPKEFSLDGTVCTPPHPTPLPSAARHSKDTQLRNSDVFFTVAFSLLMPIFLIARLAPRLCNCGCASTRRDEQRALAE